MSATAFHKRTSKVLCPTFGVQFNFTSQLLVSNFPSWFGYRFSALPMAKNYIVEMEGLVPDAPNIAISISYN